MTAPELALPPMDLPTVAAAADRALDRFANLIRSIPELSDPAVGTWSMHQVAAHLIGVVSAYADIARGDGSPYSDLSRVAEVNEARMTTIEDRTPFGLGQQIQELRPVVAAALEGPDLAVPGHDGVPLLRSVAGARILGEAVVHGWDVATAAQRMWWIEPKDAALIFRSFLPFLPLFVNREAARGVTARIDVRMKKFPEARGVFAFSDGELTVEAEPRGKVDCTVVGAPASMILVVHRRVGLANPLLRGQLAAWGRKPWLAFRLVNLFDPP